MHKLLRISPLYYALILSVFILAFLMYRGGFAQEWSDTLSYIEAWDNSYSHGELDYFRTPLYPMIIGFAGMIMGNNWGILVVILQIITFYGCGLLFSRLLLNVIPNRKVAWVCVFIYFLFIPTLKLIPMLGTELFAFSMQSAWIYFTWYFLRRPSWKYGLIITALTFLTVMLRPTFILLPIAVVCLFAVGVWVKKYRKTVLLLLLTNIPIVAVYFPYTHRMEQLYGVNTISIVSSVNLYFMARQYNDIFPELLPHNPEAVNVMKMFQKAGDPISHDYGITMWNEINYLENTGIMTHKQMQDYADAMKSNYPSRWYGNMGNRIVESFRTASPPRTAFNYLIPLIYGLLFLIAWVKYRRLALFNLLLTIVGGGYLLTILLFAPFDFARLFMPAFPIYTLMFGQLLSCISFKPLRISLRKLADNQTDTNVVAQPV